MNFLLGFLFFNTFCYEMSIWITSLLLLLTLPLSKQYDQTWPWGMIEQEHVHESEISKSFERVEPSPHPIAWPRGRAWGLGRSRRGGPRGRTWDIGEHSLSLSLSLSLSHTHKHTHIQKALTHTHTLKKHSHTHKHTLKKAQTHLLARIWRKKFKLFKSPHPQATALTSVKKTSGFFLQEL